MESNKRAIIIGLFVISSILLLFEYFPLDTSLLSFFKGLSLKFIISSFLYKSNNLTLRIAHLWVFSDLSYQFTYMSPYRETIYLSYTFMLLHKVVNLIKKTILYNINLHKYHVFFVNKYHNLNKSNLKIS